MKMKPIALAISLTMTLIALAGCHTNTSVTTTSPRAGIVGVLDREAEQLREYISRQSGDIARNNTQASNRTLGENTTDLSARHLTALIGLPDRDVRRSLGSTFTQGALANSRNYKQTVYGADTDFYVQYNDQQQVDKVVITLDEHDAARWRRELNALYGIQVDDTMASTSQWLDKNTQINWTQTGDRVRITITGKAV